MLEPNANELEKLLDRDIAQVKHLQKLLENERDALVHHDPEKLQRLVQEKLGVLDQLEKNHAETTRLSGAGAGGAVKWGNLLKQFAVPAESLQEKCDEYRTLLEQVEQQNLLNAKIANRLQHSITSLIAILRGAPRQQSLYTPRGNSINALDHASIIRA